MPPDIDQIIKRGVIRALQDQFLLTPIVKGWLAKHDEHTPMWKNEVGQDTAPTAAEFRVRLYPEYEARLRKFLAPRPGSSSDEEDQQHDQE